MNATAGATRPTISLRCERRSEPPRCRGGSPTSLPTGAGSVGVTMVSGSARALREQAVGLLRRVVELLLDLGVAGLTVGRLVEDVPEAALVGVLDLRPLRDRRVRAALLDRLVHGRVVRAAGLADRLLGFDARREHAQQLRVVGLHLILGEVLHDLPCLV